MTTAGATEGSLAGETGTDSRDIGALLRSPTGWVMVGLIVVGIGLFFNAWILKQVQLSRNHMEDWGHALLVPAISVYILWQQRHRLDGVRPRAFWPGLAPLSMGVMAYPFFIVGVPNHFGQGLALVLTVFGLVLLLLGPAVMRVAFLPIAYLVFAITLPQLVMIKITFQLQKIASQGSYVLLNILGIDTEISGNVLTITTSAGAAIPLNVAEQCSGMRTLVAFMALGAAVALVACRHWWQRVAVMILAVPVAVLLNVARVTALGIASLYNPSLASGQAHTFIGTVLLVPGFLIFMGIVWALNRCVNETPAGEAS